MKRIAVFLSTSGHSGVDRVAGHLIPALARRGYPVDLLQVRRHGPRLADIPPGVGVVDLGSRHTYGCLPGLVRYLRRARPAALLADKDRVNRTALLARALARVPTRLVLRLGTTVSVDLQGRGALERWVQRTSMGRLYPFADAVVVNAASVARDLADYTGLAPALIRVVPNPAVPDALFEGLPPPPDHPWFAPGAPPVVLGVGELGYRKDFPTLLRAFAILRRARPARLMILGRGRERAALLGLGAELGIGADLELPGFVPDPVRYMAHAAVLAFTSLWEGNPLVLAEALAVGTPVAATDCPGGVREVLDGGRYGPLVPLRDHAALAAALAETLERPLPREVLRAAARPYAVEAATDAYLEVLGLPRRAPAADLDACPSGPAAHRWPPATDAPPPWHG